MDIEDHSDFELVDKRQLMQSSLVATARVFFVACLGIYVAKRNVISTDDSDDFNAKLVKPNDLKALSNLVEHLLLPCLIFTNFIMTLDLSDWKFWLPCMIISLAIILTGAGLGYIISEFLVRDARVRYIIIASCALGHCTSIQLYLVQSLSFLLDLIPSSYGSTSLNRGTAYIMICTLINNLFRWTVGKKFIEHSKNIQDASTPVPQPLTPQTAEKKSTLKGIFNPPIIAALVSVVICMIPPVQSYIADPTRFLNRAFFVPLQLTGRSLTPIIIIILGCSLGHGQMETSRLDKTTLGSITIIRLIILPAIGSVTLFLFCHLEIITDPTMVFVLMLTYSMPTAINVLVQTTQIGDFSKEISQVLMLGYAFCTITMPLVLYLFFTTYI